jgi:hypothetical protein
MVMVYEISERGVIMFQLLYDMVLIDLLGYTDTAPEILNIPTLALVLTTILMILAVFTIFKVALALLSLPFKWLS